MADYAVMARRQTFDRWYSGLSAEEREAYSLRTGTSLKYIKTHLLTFRKIPRPDKMSALASASGFSVGELAAWFYESSLARSSRLSASRAGRKST